MKLFNLKTVKVSNLIEKFDLRKKEKKKKKNLFHRIYNVSTLAYWPESLKIIEPIYDKRISLKKWCNGFISSFSLLIRIRH